MPLYEFECKPCQTRFDVRATFSEKELGLDPECPHCHGKEVNQVITSGMFISTGGTTGAATGAGCSPFAGPGCCG